jgi:hypothetical protein
MSDEVDDGRRAVTESMRAEGRALIAIADALEGIEREQAIRILRASAILLDVDLACVGLQERRK